MALLVLCTTTSFTVDMHYCGEHLMDFSIFGNPERCAMQPEVSHNLDTCPMMEMKMDCCSDVELSNFGQDDLKVEFSQLSFEHQVFLTTYVYSYVNLFIGRFKENVPFRDYSPPPLIQDVQILNQTFLI